MTLSDKTYKDLMKNAKIGTLPDLYFRLQNLLNGPEYTMAEVAVLIRMDPAISLRLLHIVNSSLYGFSRKVETVGHAITLLGTQQVADLVLTTSVVSIFRGIPASTMDMQRFLRNSVFCASAARQLADMCKECDLERLFVAGLLHDIGHLIMYQAIPTLAHQALVAARTTSEPLFKLETKRIGYHYGEVGSSCLTGWSLPECLCETTLCHVEPEKAVRYPQETAIVHIAMLLARAAEGQGVFNEGALGVSETAWQVTGLTAHDCVACQEEIKKTVEEAGNLLFA